jgi:4-amino-4-deoxy-L-arabinose transferase-like glycosyltransferase
MCVPPLVDSVVLGEPNRLRVFAAAALLAAILYVCFFSGLDTLGLVGPDEPRYAAIAREMAATGDWVTPRLFGQPWFEKPALYYWSAALAFRSGLTNETAARLPSGVFALLATLGMAWSARRFYGARTALAFLLMLPTCAGMIGFAHAAAPDMHFAACLTLAMVAAAQILWASQRARQASPLQDEQNRRQEPQWAWACAWGFFLGLATLAKGPAALALAAGSVALWVIATRRWRDALRLFHPAGIATFCATALPWYTLCAARNPTFLRVFLLEHNFERFTTNRYQHAQPFWFFAPILLLALFPWTFLLGACGQDALRLYREKRLAGSPAVFFACWAIFPFLFFSVSQSKLPGYILPAVPPLVLLIARSVRRSIDAGSRPPLRGARATVWALLLGEGGSYPRLNGVAIAFLLLAFAGARWLPRLPADMGDVRSGVVIVGLSACLAMGVVGVLSFFRRPRAVVWTAAISIAALVVVTEQRLLPSLDGQVSPRAAARTILNAEGGPRPVAVYRISRAWQYGLNFYFDKEIPEWTPQPGYAWVITNDAGSYELRRLGVHRVEERRISRQATVLHLE